MRANGRGVWKKRGFEARNEERGTESACSGLILRACARRGCFIAGRWEIAC